MGQLATCSFELVARFLHAIEEAMDAVNRTGRRRGNNAWQALAGKKGTRAEAKGIESHTLKRHFSQALGACQFIAPLMDFTWPCNACRSFLVGMGDEHLTHDLSRPRRGALAQRSAFKSHICRIQKPPRLEALVLTRPRTADQPLGSPVIVIAFLEHRAWGWAT